MEIVIISTPQGNNNTWIELLKDKFKADEVKIVDDYKKVNGMYIVPNDLYVNDEPCKFVKELLKMKIKDQQMKDRQKTGLNIHKSKKNKRYF